MDVADFSITFKCDDNSFVCDASDEQPKDEAANCKEKCLTTIAVWYRAKPKENADDYGNIGNQVKKTCNLWCYECNGTVVTSILLTYYLITDNFISYRHFI